MSSAAFFGPRNKKCLDLGMASQESPMLVETLPLTTRTLYFTKLWGLKLVTILGFKIVRTFRPPPKEINPSIIKAYPCRPRLRNRIFIPKSHKPGELLPLYIDMHAGGHTLLDAQFDDEFCCTFANKLNVLVVSLEYSTAPESKFPEPTNDVVAITQAIMKDETLPVDLSRVVLGGFSAGANLAFSAAQMSGLKDKIKGIVSCYPVLDMTITPADKQKTRAYRHSKDMDALKDWGPIWTYAYVKPGQDLRDPLISTKYAHRDNLPKWICMVGAEFDMLGEEARQNIFDLASLDKAEREEGHYEFEKGAYKWLLVRDVMHGFTHDLMDSPGAEAVAMNKKRTAEMIEDVGPWLFKGPYAK
ncbi:Neutral cholesterol ester hydrolase [Lachnellula suecica]|uniref:Neutral cholesterol ester hydrolase n=1 Tax=Lachnellula suecica TaxID=602035 RepID=A0A8T9C1N8_9HELO|nr:Neutral cholesterol ester hydrolase [Lachnellula suecica]